MKLYADLMEEIKVRLVSIDETLSGNLQFPSALAREYIFLQFRMICELIALGCLVAHGDIPATQEGRLKSAWKADFIIAELEKLHPAFYPSPMQQVLMTDSSDPGERHFGLEPVSSGFLTKGELVKLYGKCGDVLHKGNIKKLPSSPQKDQADNSELIQITQRFRNLLNHHVIHCLNEATMYACGMRDAQTGNVFWAIFERQ